ncbi:MAG: NAD-binding protein [Sutterella wadsworthensis]
MLLGWPLDTALVMGACVSQLGEFSFILCGQGIALGIATPGTMSIVVAASILTIALNPLMFTAIPHVRNLLVSRRPFFARMAERVSPLASVEPKTIKGHVLIAGVNEVVLALLPRLEARGIDFTCFVMSDTTAAVVDSYKHGSAIVGNPSDPALLVQGHLVDAEVLVLPSSDMVLNKTVFAAARELKHDCRIIVRVASPENLRAVPSDEHTRILNDTQIASESLGEAVADVFGIGAQVRHEKAVARGEATNDIDEDEGAAIIAQAPRRSRREAPPGMRPVTLPPFGSSTASGRRWRSAARKRRGRRPPSRPPRPLRLPRVVKPQTPRSMRPPFPRLKSPPSSPA